MKGEKSIPGKLYHKMVAVNMLTSLIPLVLFSIFSLYTFNNNYLQLISRQYSDAIETSSTILGYYLDSFYNIVKLNIDDNQDVSIRTLETIFSESTEEEERRRQIEVLLEELSQANPYIRSCLFVDREGSVYSFHRDGKELILRCFCARWITGTGIGTVKSPSWCRSMKPHIFQERLRMHCPWARYMRHPGWREHCISR